MFPKQSTRSLLRQRLRDLRDTLRRVPFARPRAGQPDSMPVRITERHVFKPSPTLENKKANLREAARRINAVTVLPGEVFSFWHTVATLTTASDSAKGEASTPANPHAVWAAACARLQVCYTTWRFSATSPFWNATAILHR